MRDILYCPVRPYNFMSAWVGQSCLSEIAGNYLTWISKKLVIQFNINKIIWKVHNADNGITWKI